MARSTSLGKFARRMGIVAQGIANNTEKGIKRAAILGDEAMVTSTPVDTGRAKGNWNVGIGTPDLAVSDRTDASGSVALSKARSIIEAWNLGRGVIFISNALPYIGPLNDGSSKQAPQGMTEHGLLAMRRSLQTTKLLG